jgi:hypothetical protein
MLQTAFAEWADGSVLTQAGKSGTQCRAGKARPTLLTKESCYCFTC